MLQSHPSFIHTSLVYNNCILTEIQIMVLLKDVGELKEGVG